MNQSFLTGLIRCPILPVLDIGNQERIGSCEQCLQPPLYAVPGIEMTSQFGGDLRVEVQESQRSRVFGRAIHANDGLGQAL